MAKKGNYRCGALLLFVYFLFFMPLIKNAHAQEKIIYDGWLYTANSSKTITGENFTLLLDDSKTLASVIFEDGESFLVRQNQSETKNSITVSFKGTRFGYYDPHKPSSYGTYTQYDEAHIVISALVANIDFQLGISNDEIEVGDTTIINTTFLNNGSRTAENVGYIASFPSSVKIMNIQGCDFRGDYVEWRGSLLSYQKAGCSLELLALKPDVFSANAILNYSDGVSNISTKKSIGLRIKNYSLDIKNQLNNYNKSMNVSDIVNLSIELKNINSDRDIEVDFSLSTTDGLQIIDKSSLLSGNGWKGTLAVNSAPKQFYVVLQATKSGIQEVRERGIFRIGFTQTINEKTIQLNVSQKKLKTIYKIKNQTNGFGVEVGLTNSESKLLFKSINASVIFINDAYNFSIDAIEPGYYFSIFRKNFSLDELNISNFITVKAYYSGFYGESFTLNEIRNITTPITFAAKIENKTIELNATLVNLTNATNITANANITNATLDLNKTSNRTKTFAFGWPSKGDTSKKLIAWIFVFLFLLSVIFFIMSLFKKRAVKEKI